MTDNGSCYRSFAFRKACRDLGLKHIRTRPYTPKTNGKAERFIQTALREWAYAQRLSNTHDHRADELPVWLHRYNWHRPHGSIECQTTHQPPRPDRGQPVEAPQLERLHDSSSALRSSSVRPLAITLHAGHEPREHERGRRLVTRSAFQG